MTPPTLAAARGRDPVRVMRTGRRVAATPSCAPRGPCGGCPRRPAPEHDRDAGRGRQRRYPHPARSTTTTPSESLTITFRRNGQYDPRALEQLNWFLRDWRLDEPTQMDPRLFDTLWEVHREVGSSEAIHVNSAYRSPHTNAMLRRRSSAVAKNSQHMRGKAMDFYLPGRADRAHPGRRHAPSGRRRRLSTPPPTRRSSISTSAACAPGRA